MMLLRLALLHMATPTTVIALFPFLRLTFSLLCVLGRRSGQKAQLFFFSATLLDPSRKNILLPALNEL
jgi:hypothetical protein